MDLRQMRYFMAIADKGNFSAAAEYLHMAQPPLSRQIKQLEDELGVTLLERGSRQITLTSAGQVFLDKSINILKASELLEKQMSNFSLGTEGTLRLGTVSSSGATYLDEHVIQFCKDYPSIKFDILEGNTFSIVEALEKNKIELGIVRIPFGGNHYKQYCYQKEPMLAVAKKDFFQDLPEKTISLKQLVKSPIIIYKRYEKLFREVCFEEKLSLHIICKNDDVRTTLLWANAGIGIALVPASALQLVNHDDLEAKAIEHQKLFTQVCVIWKPDRPLSPVATNFLKYISNKSE